METKHKRGTVVQTPQVKKSSLVSFLHSLFISTNKAPAVVVGTPITQQVSVSGIENLVKMGEACKILKASPPTVRKYARLGYYKEYRFGQKLVFYNKEEMLNFLINGTYAKK